MTQEWIDNSERWRLMTSNDGYKNRFSGKGKIDGMHQQRERKRCSSPSSRPIVRGLWKIRRPLKGFTGNQKTEVFRGELALQPGGRENNHKIDRR